jgi:hypothetical protein
MAVTPTCRCWSDAAQFLVDIKRDLIRAESARIFQSPALVIEYLARFLEPGARVTMLPPDKRDESPRVLSPLAAKRPLLEGWQSRAAVNPMSYRFPFCEDHPDPRSSGSPQPDGSFPRAKEDTQRSAAQSLRPLLSQ